jgi:sigma-B regulation protein RsbU (phosphoserine phosphatase)
MLWFGATILKQVIAATDSTLHAHNLSGDFFDYLQRCDGKYPFCAWCIAGSGNNAGLLMAETASLIQWQAKQSLAPARLNQ